MTNRNDPFDTHGDTGVQPNAGRDFQSGGNPSAQEFDWWWYTVITKFRAINAEFNRLDSDDDGVVDEADYARTANATSYKGEDLDTDGNGKADTAEFAEDADATTYKGSDIDSDGSGVVDEAETVSGNDGVAHYAGSLPRFANTTDGLNNTSEGDQWYNEADNSVYLNNGQ